MDIKKGINLVHFDLKNKLIADINEAGIPAVNLRCILGELYDIALKHEQDEIKQEQNLYMEESTAAKKAAEQEEGEVS